MTRSQTARRKRQRIRLAIRNTASLLSIFAFLAMLGDVGAVECDRVPLLEGTVRMFGFMFIWAGLLLLAGAFPVRKERRKCHEVHRNTVAGPGRTSRQKPYSSWRKENHDRRNRKRPFRRHHNNRNGPFQKNL